MNFNASDDVQYYEKPLCEKLLNEINYSFYNLMFFLLIEIIFFKWTNIGFSFYIGIY